MEAAEPQLRAALLLASELGMRPLVARSRLCLAGVWRRAGNTDRAADELAAAGALFRKLGMRFWLARAEEEGSSLSR
jgi:hypothetical protein